MGPCGTPFPCWTSVGGDRHVTLEGGQPNGWGGARDYLAALAQDIVGQNAAHAPGDSGQPAPGVQGHDPAVPGAGGVLSGADAH